MAHANQVGIRRSSTRLEREPAATGSIHASQYLTGTPESVLWGEVLLRAIDDFKVYTAHRSDPEANPVSAKTLRSILADGCDPEYWFFGTNTGFDAVCMVLNVEPDVIRRHLRAWIDEIDDELATSSPW